MHRGKLLLPGVFLIGMLVWPVAGLAAGPTLQGGADPATIVSPNLALPPITAGATVGMKNWADAQAWGGAADNHIGYYASDPNGTDVWVMLDIPAGSTLLRIDAYGYRSTAGTLVWSLFDMDTVNGTEAHTDFTSPSGTGVIDTTFNVIATVATGHQLQVDLRNSSATIGLVGVIYQYVPPSMTFFPMSPTRVYDSRFSTAMTVGTNRTISVATAINPSTGAGAGAAVPAGARAITYTITLSQTVGAGNVGVFPGGTAVATASTINWSTSGLDIATGSVVTLGTGGNERKITMFLGGAPGASSHVIIDVTGYYM
jgi:hypothetical protein